jgi:hypothetical protein
MTVKSQWIILLSVKPVHADVIVLLLLHRNRWARVVKKNVTITIEWSSLDISIQILPRTQNKTYF